MWQRSLGHAVDDSALPCGNISPLGITGTPVIDDVKGAVYLDAMLNTEDSGPQHLVFGLALDDGAILPGYPLNVATALRSLEMKFTPSIQNQRSALTIVGRTLFVPYGGHFGDCGPYHGWVVGIGLDEPPTIAAWSTRAAGGGVWAPGGISYDGRSLFASTGNTKDTEEWADGEARHQVGRPISNLQRARVISSRRQTGKRSTTTTRISAARRPLPIDVQDRTGVARLVLALGKDGKAYLLNRDNLGGIGGALAVKQVARGPIITAPAVYPAMTARWSLSPDTGAIAQAEHPPVVCGLCWA